MEPKRLPPSRFSSSTRVIHLRLCMCARFRFRPVMAFVVLWELLIYYPIARWVWSPDGFLYKLGTLDFAGVVAGSRPLPPGFARSPVRGPSSSPV